jgi:hypothetical protein
MSTLDKNYDYSWDLRRSPSDNLPISKEAHDRKFHEWEKRDWMTWLEQNLSFPFTVERKEDDDDAYFTDIATREPFRLGHKMKVLSIVSEDERYGINIKVREGRRTGYVPLCDLEVIPKSDINYWPVREYVVWFANK